MGNIQKREHTFGERLTDLMIERGLYPAEVERLTGIRRQRLYEYAKGISEPRERAIKLIALGLNVSADWLLGIKD